MAKLGALAQFATVVAAISIAGCQSLLRSTPVRQGAEAGVAAPSGNDGNRRRGQREVGGRPALVYALPMRLVRLTVSQAPVQGQAFSAAVTRFVAAQTAKTEAETAARQAQTRVTDLTTHRLADANAVTQAAIDEARVALDNAQSQVRTTTLALASAEANLRLQQSGAATPELALSIKFEALSAIPDPSAVYQAHFSHSVHRDDTVTLATDANGLLTSSQVTATDRTADILVDVAGIAGLREAEEFSVLGEQDPPVRDCNLGRTFTREFIFDPAASADRSRVDSWLERCLGLRLLDPGVAAFSNRPTEAPVNGVVYRRPVPYVLTVTRPGGNASADDDDVLASAVAMLPQGGPYGVVRYEPRAFVQSVTNVAFEAGQPTSWHSSNPSEVAAAFRIPVAMARALVEIPATMFKLRVDYSSRQSELVSAQRNYICALEALAEAEGRETANNCDATP